MSRLRAFRLFTRNPPSTSESTPVNADESRQFDLLLRELNAHEQQLPSDYWTTRAQAFADKMVAAARSEKARRSARYSQLKPYLTSLLPIGGLLALGLSFTGTYVDTDASDALNETARTALAPEASIAQPLPVATTSDDDLPSPLVEQHRPVGSLSTKAATKPLRRTARHDASNQTRHADHSTTFAPARAFVDTSQGMLASTVAPSLAPRQLTPPPELTENDTFAQQLQALKRADKALKAGNTSEAKAALARSFSPAVLLHAQALRAILLCQSNDPIGGKRYLDAQAKSHPNSPYLERMRRACGVSAVGRD